VPADRAEPSQGTSRVSNEVLYDIKGGLRPPAGCARLASLAVLAGQHREHDVGESSARMPALNGSELA